MIRKFAILLALIALFSSCGRKKDAAKTPAVNTPSVINQTSPSAPPAPAEPATQKKPLLTLNISPSDPMMKTTINIYATGFELSMSRLQWHLNGAPVSAPDPMNLKPADISSKRGDEIQLKAYINNEEVLSNIIEVKNSPPELTNVKLMPEQFMPGDTIRIDAEAEDPDMDPVVIEYEWSRNGLPAGRSSSIGARLRRGDKFTVRVTPYDGLEYGRFIYLEREMKNNPPMFRVEYDYTFDGKTYSYRVKGYDPDGDKLTYSLKSAPEGMGIDSASGLVTWAVPPELIGKTVYEVLADDGNGGVSIMTLSFTLTAEEEPK